MPGSGIEGDMNNSTSEDEEFEVYEEGDATSTGVPVPSGQPVREAAAVISLPPPPPTQQGKKRKVSFADSVDVKWYHNTGAAMVAAAAVSPVVGQ